MPEYLIQEEIGSFKFILEEGSGFILLEESAIYRPLRTVLGSNLRNT